MAAVWEQFIWHSHTSLYFLDHPQTHPSSCECVFVLTCVFYLCRSWTSRWEAKGRAVRTSKRCGWAGSGRSKEEKTCSSWHGCAISKDMQPRMFISGKREWKKRHTQPSSFYHFWLRDKPLISSSFMWINPLFYFRHLRRVRSSFVTLFDVPILKFRHAVLGILRRTVWDQC